jgi:hypothetical protein
MLRTRFVSRVTAFFLSLHDLPCRSASWTIVLLSVASLELLAQDETKYFFYHPDHAVGSDANFNPITLLLNGSFDATRTEGHSRDVFALPYKDDLINVWKNISDPLTSINRYGWQAFRREEIINLSFNYNQLQFLPNILDHAIGYGMLYTKTREWYDYHRYPVPFLWSVVTSLVYKYMNEMIQNGGNRGTNVDCISDILIFNTMGFAFFSFDRVNRFFSESIHLYEWSLQPLYIPADHHLQNTGQEFVLRYPIPGADRYAPFLYWGVNSVAGLSYRYEGTNSISVGFGESVYKGISREYRKDLRRFFPSERDGAAGLFLDDDGSLLVSLIVEGPNVFNVQLNAYPGLIRIGGIQPGLYVAAVKRDKFVCGISFMTIPISIGIE